MPLRMHSVCDRVVLGLEAGEPPETDIAALVDGFWVSPT